MIRNLPVLFLAPAAIIFCLSCKRPCATPANRNVHLSDQFKSRLFHLGKDTLRLKRSTGFSYELKPWFLAPAMQCNGNKTADGCEGNRACYEIEEYYYSTGNDFEEIKFRYYVSPETEMDEMLIEFRYEDYIISNIDFDTSTRRIPLRSFNGIPYTDVFYTTSAYQGSEPHYDTLFYTIKDGVVATTEDYYYWTKY